MILSCLQSENVRRNSQAQYRKEILQSRLKIQSVSRSPRQQIPTQYLLRIIILEIEPHDQISTVGPNVRATTLQSTARLPELTSKSAYPHQPPLPAEYLKALPIATRPPRLAPA